MHGKLARFVPFVCPTQHSLDNELLQRQPFANINQRMITCLATAPSPAPANTRPQLFGRMPQQANTSTLILRLGYASSSLFVAITHAHSHGLLLQFNQHIDTSSPMALGHHFSITCLLACHLPKLRVELT